MKGRGEKGNKKGVNQEGKLEGNGAGEWRQIRGGRRSPGWPA